MTRVTKLKMSSTPHDLRLFGIDLHVLWQDMRRPWQDMHRWPVLAWLAPTVPVRLLHADGHEAVWLGNQESIQAPNAKAKASRFVALQLPEDLILRQRFLVPAMPEAQTMEAVALEVRTMSPFAPDDLVWGYSAIPGASDQSQIEIVLASRRQIEQYLQTQTARLAGLPAPEVWALAEAGRPIVLAGFGEVQRAQHVSAWRRVGYGLLLLVVGILMVIALTPTAQLRFRAVEAVNAYTEVHDRTRPLAAKREELVKTTDQLAALGEVVSSRIDPLKVMDLLTQALPDDTSLLGLQIQGLKVTMNGQTTNAAALMQHLSTQPGMRDVRAPSAATRPLGVSKESFTVEFTLDPKALLPVAAMPAETPATTPGAATATAQGASAPASAPSSAAAQPKPALTAASATVAGKTATPIVKSTP